MTEAEKRYEERMAYLEKRGETYIPQLIHDATAKIYKVVDGAEVLIGTASSNEFGGICFAINDLATYA